MTHQESYRILLVEDNELDARSMARALSTQAGCEVQRVADLAGALDALRLDAFDCVLLDLSLPDSEGLVSVETVVARSPQCPVVVLTGLDSPETAVEAVARGAQDYLVKNTITPELVVRAIRYAVARHSAETELRVVQSRLNDMASREQIARDLHDTVIQRLFATGMSLQVATSMSPKDLADRATKAVDEIDDAIRELRQAIFGLHSLDESESLSRELAQIAESYRNTLGFEPVMRLAAIPDISNQLRQDLTAVVREGLSNVGRHANASAVTLSVFVEGDQLVVRVTDNGDGRNNVATGATKQDQLSGNGLVNMRARAEAHGGHMDFDAVSAGGSELIWTVPVTREGPG